MTPEELEKFIAKHFAGLPRKYFAVGRKEQIWLRIQNHLRQNRVAPQEKIKASGLMPVFRFGKLAVSTLVVIVAISLVGGATKASEGSLPGDTLYTVKKAAESVEKVFATTDEAKIQVGIKHAKRRLEEVKILVQEKKDQTVVSETLAALKDTTKQVLVIASESSPELINNAVDLVNEEEKVLDSVKDQTEGQVKEAVQDIIATSKESANKLKTEEVKGAAVTEPAESPTTTPPVTPQKPKVKDGVIESEIQIHGIMNSEEQENPKPSQPEILPEPTLGF